MNKKIREITDSDIEEWEINLSFLGFEIDKSFISIANKRINNLKSQLFHE